MSVQAFAHRMSGVAACAAVGICAFALPASVEAQVRPAPAASAASAPKHIDNTPLRFDPPAAGRRGPTRAEYVRCIERPSPDGLYTDCSDLLPDDPPKTAKPR